jgi:hypothetical protein
VSQEILVTPPGLTRRVANKVEACHQPLAAQLVRQATHKEQIPYSQAPCRDYQVEFCDSQVKKQPNYPSRL